MCSSDENGPSCPQKMHLKGGFVVKGLVSIVPNSWPNHYVFGLNPMIPASEDSPTIDYQHEEEQENEKNCNGRKIQPQNA